MIVAGADGAPAVADPSADLDASLSRTGNIEYMEDGSGGGGGGAQDEHGCDEAAALVTLFEAAVT